MVDLMKRARNKGIIQS